ncbi:MAG: nucleoside triphosphate pyrophosphohydrolase family protein [Saprospiraceae bacterium]|nr:nucleoside triphosphate pyrophosphohydrolase family protein [Saprospiraceae bacterium]
MREAQALNGVARFHQTFGMPILEQPTIPAEERCKLRINLLQEELDELRDAIRDNDLVEVADALCDLQYVLSGAVLEFGLGQQFADLFDEVQRSNMSKVCSTREIAERTVEYYRREKGIEGHVVERDGRYLVYRTSDQKVLKSVEYSPADLPGRLNTAPSHSV